MGSEGNSMRIDASVGGLVWVRRRNGSWWPGRIMGLHELSESCLVSPRSGTPVKLLGREDASVDWYNLEKSRRVKAFRCGEYDECIEKAKASAAHSNKKAVKYARREDAILHALELESARESDEHHVFQSRRGSSSGSEHDYMDEKESMSEANQTKELSQSGISFEDPNHVSTPQLHCLQKTRRKTPNDSEEDGSEGTKRMRGLQDLGVGVLSKRKASIDSSSEGSDELLQQDSASYGEPNVCNSLSNESAVNRSRSSFSYLRKKRAQVAVAHENYKRKDRRRPLTKVLESTAMVSVPVSCDQGTSPGRSSIQGVADSKLSALESTDLKKMSISAVVNNNSNCTGASCNKETLLDASLDTCDAGHHRSDPMGSDFSTILEFPENESSDGLFDVPFVGEGKNTQGFSPVSYASGKLQSGASGRNSNYCSKVEPISLSNEGPDESGSTSLTVDVNCLSSKIEKHTSKWQLKGKRNTRVLSHRTSKCLEWRSLERDPELDVSLAGKHHTDGISRGLGRKLGINTLDESLTLETSVDRSSQVSDPEYLDTINYGRWTLSNREGVIQSMDGEGNLLNSLSHEKSAVAKLATQVRNKDLYLRDRSVSPPIPHRSLPYRQSRFTPHSKYQDAYVPSRNAFGDYSLFDVNLEVRASYRGQHVPLVSLMSKLNGKAIVGHPVTVEVWDDGYCDHLMSSIDCCPTSSNGELYEGPTENMSDQSFDINGSSMNPVKHLGVQSSFSPKKCPNTRKCGLLSKKTRRLSSFTVAPERSNQDRKPVVEKLGGPVIACVPLNVVFSRINEALNGSARPAHRNSTSITP